jgi:hypothetical protein
VTAILLGTENRYGNNFKMQPCSDRIDENYEICESFGFYSGAVDFPFILGDICPKIRANLLLILISIV